MPKPGGGAKSEFRNVEAGKKLSDDVQWCLKVSDADRASTEGNEDLPRKNYSVLVSFSQFYSDETVGAESLLWWERFG